MYKSLAVLLFLSYSALSFGKPDKPPPTFVARTPARVGPHFAAPEMDPASVLAGVALLVGGLMVLGGRIPKQ
jgi:hypothetical protein